MAKVAKISRHSNRSISTRPPTGSSDIGTFDLFQVWKEYEGVAMHFNDLLMRLRTQSLAAVATFATATGVLLKAESVSGAYRWGTLEGVFVALAVVWIAVWILDFAYYNRLLRGAVDALIRVEQASQAGRYLSHIELSTVVELTVLGERAPLDGRAESEDRLRAEQRLERGRCLQRAAVECGEHTVERLQRARHLEIGELRAQPIPQRRRLHASSTATSVVSMGSSLSSGSHAARSAYVRSERRSTSRWGTRTGRGSGRAAR